jgi:hypothetical protein
MGYSDNCHPGREWLLLSGSLKMTQKGTWFVQKFERMDAMSCWLLPALSGNLKVADTEDMGCPEIQSPKNDVVLVSSYSLRELKVNSGHKHVSFQNPLERNHGLLLSFSCPLGCSKTLEEGEMGDSEILPIDRDVFLSSAFWRFENMHNTKHDLFEN